jgi:hypothetical protein
MGWGDVGGVRRSTTEVSEMTVHGIVSRRTAALGLTLPALLLSAACGGGDGGADVVEATGNTGMCTESGTTWTGDAPAGSAVPGLVLERTLTCPSVTMSDDRVSGSLVNEFRCDFALQGGTTIGECVQNSAITNEGGTWEETDAPFTITLTSGEPTAVVQEGIKNGTGDYTGLRWVYRVDGGADYPWSIEGTIEPLD